MYKLLNACSIFTAECIAILKALQNINNHNLADTIIFTDSLSAINSIKNTHKTSDISTHIQNYIHNLHKNNFKIKIFWIPGHSIINGNERLVQAAKNATTSTQSSPLQIISRIDELNLIKSKYIVTCYQQWTSKSTKLHEMKQNIHHWPFPLNYPESSKS